jgi:hypothetical protein
MPAVVLVPLQPPLAVQLVALVVLHMIILFCPEAMLVGLADMLTTGTGVGVGLGVGVGVGVGDGTGAGTGVGLVPE